MSTLGLGAIVGLTVAVGAYLFVVVQDAPKVQALRDYFFGNWDLRADLIAATIFSSAMSLATVVIALIQLGFLFGVAISWATLTFCAGWAVYQIAVPLIRRNTSPRDTLHSFLGRAYSSRALTVVASATTIIGLLGLFATELFAADVLIRAAGFSPRATPPLIGFLGFLAIAHAAFGGFRSVVRSDRYQTILLLLTLPALLALAIGFWLSGGAPSPPLSGTASSLLLPGSVVLGLFMINVPFPFVDTIAWQRARAAYSDSDFKQGNMRAIIGFGTTWTVLISIGVLISPLVAPSDEPFVAIFRWAGSLHPSVSLLVGILVFPGLVAAMLSSSDAFLNSAAHAFCLDITDLRKAGDDDIVAVPTRRYVALLGAIGLGLTLLLRQSGFSIIDLVFAVYAGTLALFPAVAVALFMRRRAALPGLKVAAHASTIAGFLAAWMNGFYSIRGLPADGPIAEWIGAHIPRDVYQSPGYAFLTSSIVFGLVWLVARQLPPRAEAA